jgi:hypothetical protein
LCRQNDPSTDRGRLAVLSAMAGAVHKTGNAVLVDNYAQKTALRLAVNPDAVRAEFRKFATSKPEPAPSDEGSEESATPTAETPPPSAHEFWLLKVLFLHEELVGWAAMHLEPTWIQHEAVREIVTRRLQALAEESWASLAAFLDTCESPAMQNLITHAVADGRALPNPAQQLADVTLRLRNQFLDRGLAALLHLASQPETSNTEQLALLRQRQQLQERKRQPLAPLTSGH